MQDEIAIQAQGLTVRFGDLAALRDVSLEARRASVFGLLGPNGAGKSTFVRVCLGLLPPSEGRVRVLGLDPVRNAREIRRRAGFVLEHPGLYENLSCRSNLEFFARVYRLPAREVGPRIDALLAAVGLADRAGDPAGALSRGLKQRLTLARALLHRPELIFLDEPTSGLDPAAAWEIRGVIARLVAEERVTVLITTHNMAEAERLCDEAAILRRGEVVKRIDPDELRQAAGIRVRCGPLDRGHAEGMARAAGAVDLVFSATVTEFVFEPDRDLEPVMRSLQDSGAEVVEVVRPGLGLEQLYLSVTEGGLG
ncbi:MAG: ABC transporter ATP-binding protein [Acetobacteraceae bacterium]|nr:ABC transporter ATP-binding protein [Acetobacteraceae bacterium]